MKNLGSIVLESLRDSATAAFLFQLVMVASTARNTYTGMVANAEVMADLRLATLHLALFGLTIGVLSFIIRTYVQLRKERLS
jgi:hypothetical protein